MEELERAGENVGLSFKGKRIVTFGEAKPSIKSDHPALSLRTESRRYEGDFHKVGRAYRVRYRLDKSPVWKVIQCDGASIAYYDEGVPPGKYDGLSGRAGTTDMQLEVRLHEHFGVFYPGLRTPIDSERLSAFLKRFRFSQVAGTADHLKLWKFDTPRVPFYVAVAPNSSDVEMYGFLFRSGNTETVQEWSNKAYIEVGHARMPSKVQYRQLVVDRGQRILDSSYEFEFESMTANVSIHDVHVPLPEGIVLQTIEGDNGGRVAVRNGRMQAVSPDYGTPGYRRRQLVIWLTSGIALLAALALGLYARWRRFST